MNLRKRRRWRYWLFVDAALLPLRIASSSSSLDVANETIMRARREGLRSAYMDASFTGPNLALLHNETERPSEQ